MLKRNLIRLFSCLLLLATLISSFTGLGIKIPAVTADTSVANLAALVAAYDADGDHIIDLNGDTVTVTGQLLFSAVTYKITNGTLKRGSASINLITTNNVANLTLENVTIDGNKSVYTATKPMIAQGNKADYVYINSGTVLQNQKTMTTGTTTGIIYVFGTVIMNGGSIQNNESNKNGVIILNSGSGSNNPIFIMNGGSITNNTCTGFGGAIYDNGQYAGQVTINGGTISGNTAGTGSAIYITGPNNILTLKNSSGIQSDQTIYLGIAITPSFISVTNPLVNTLTVQSGTPAENMVIAQGSGYPLTPADRDKLSYNGGGWYFELDATNNDIYLTQTHRCNVTADSAISGGALAFNPSRAEAGSAVNITVTPNPGKKLTDGSLKYTTDGGATYVNITDAVDANTYTFTMPSANAVITAQFEDSVAGFSISVDGSITSGAVTASPGSALSGDSVTVTVTPNAHKTLTPHSLKFTADGGATYTDITETGGIYSFTMPAHDVTITAQFEDVIHTVTFQASNAGVQVNGAPTTATTVNEVSGLTFTATADTGYELFSVISTGGTITGNGGGSYTLNDVLTDVTVTVNANAVLTNADLTIYTADELFVFAAAVNNGDNFNGKVVRLGADIDLKNAPWTCIGYKTSQLVGTPPPYVYIDIDHRFCGIFDGDGHTVSGLSASGEIAGFFGHTNNAVIKNLTVRGNVSGTYAGGIVGVADNTDIVNCVNYASVSNGYYAGGIAGRQTRYSAGIYGCVNYGDVTGRSDIINIDIGGIAGSSDRITCCVNHGAVSGGTDNFFSWDSISGIVGGDVEANTLTIDRCYNTGAVTGAGMNCGGIIGHPYFGVTITNCYNTGTITNTCNSGSTKDPAAAGGIIGYAQARRPTNISNCYSYGVIQHTGMGPGATGDIYARTNDATFTNNYCSPQDNFNAASLGNAYVDDNTNINHGLPVLAWQVTVSNYRVTFSTTDTVTVLDKDNQTINNSGTAGVYIIPTGTYSYTTTGNAKGSFNVIDANRTINLAANAVFNVNPANATVVLLNSSGNTAAHNGVEGSYTALPNDTYSYTISAAGYTPVTGHLLLAGIDRTVTVTLADSSLIYNVTADNGITYGVINFSPSSGTAGTTITVTITPNPGKQYKEGSLKYTSDIPHAGWTALTVADGTSSFIMPTGNVMITAQFERIPTALFDITKAPAPDPFTMTTNVPSAMASDEVTVTVSEPNESFTAWCEGIVITGATSGNTYTYTTVTPSIEYNDAASSEANNAAGVYTFTMPDEPVTVSMTPAYSLLKVYLQVGSGEKMLVHAYTRAEMVTLIDSLSAVNANPVYYAMWDRMGATFMGKAARYITLDQFIANVQIHNSAVRFDSPGCMLKGRAVDPWTLNRDWTYLDGTPRYYYAALGDQYLDPANRLGSGRVQVPIVLSLMGWSGRTEYVDGRPYDTVKAYRFFYGLSEEQYADGNPPSADQFDARCTANDSGKWISELTFIVPQNYSVTIDGSISGGTVTANPTGGLAGTAINVSVAPGEGKKLVTGSLKYTTDGGGTYTEISENGGAFSFTMPANDVMVTAQFTDINAATYAVIVDASITRGVISVSSASETAGAVITVTVTPDSGKRLAYNSLIYTWNDGSPCIVITAVNGIYSFILPAHDVVVTAWFEDIPAAIYTVTPQASAVYTTGATSKGITMMTVINGVNGLKYFRVNIKPVIPHPGQETVVFVHMRNGVELERAATRADFDILNSATAAFNVQAGDYIVVYVADKLTNNSIPVILQ